MTAARRHTLIINPSQTYCGNCGAGLRIEATTCTDTIGYAPRPGCGERFVLLDTDYYGVRTPEDLRPDLTPSGLLESQISTQEPSQ